jgi:hypothetical protein
MGYEVRDAIAKTSDLTDVASVPESRSYHI